MPIAKVETLRKLGGNRTCADCATKGPQWASVSHGTLHCLECSGQHRGLGVHISFVRSIQMDSWTKLQIKSMEVGGNDRLNQYLAQNGVPRDLSIPQKYGCEPCKFYRRLVLARRDGKAPPKEACPAYVGTGGGGGGGGGGRSETPTERAVREREEAAERLRKKFGSGGMRSQAVGYNGQTFDPSMEGMGGGGGGGGGDGGGWFGAISSMAATVGKGASTGLSYAAQAAQRGASEARIGERAAYVKSMVTSESTRTAAVDTVKSAGSWFGSAMSSAVSTASQYVGKGGGGGGDDGSSSSSSGGAASGVDRSAAARDVVAAAAAPGDSRSSGSGSGGGWFSGITSAMSSMAVSSTSEDQPRRAVPAQDDDWLAKQLNEARTNLESGKQRGLGARSLSSTAASSSGGGDDWGDEDWGDDAASDGEAPAATTASASAVAAAGGGATATSDSASASGWGNEEDLDINLDDDGLDYDASSPPKAAAARSSAPSAARDIVAAAAAAAPLVAKAKEEEVDFFANF